MKTLVSSIALIAILMTCSIAPAQVKHDGFDQILKNYVKEGHVAYADLRDHAKFDLYAYLDYLANMDVSLMSRDEQLAYYLNLYNASAIKGIIERWHSGFTPSEKEHELFKAPIVNLSGGRKMSLNDLANKVIRPTFKDPRINAALVYGARGNMPLMNRAYRTDDLNETLDTQMKKWINDPAFNKIDRENKKLVLSKLFEWFGDDFGGRNALPAYISKYAEGGSVEGYSVEFADFDWSLNS
jgi:hypothetical protein